MLYVMCNYLLLFQINPMYLAFSRFRARVSYFSFFATCRVKCCTLYVKAPEGVVDL